MNPPARTCQTFVLGPVAAASLLVLTIRLSGGGLQRHVLSLVVHFFDTGRFALETRATKIAAAIS